MTDELDTLRPEVREAMVRLGNYLHITIDGKHFRSEDYDTIRAELLRLQSTESRANEWQLRAERAEAWLAESRETIKRLNRRVQVAEAGVADKVKASGGGFGRSLANAAAAMFMRERDEAQAELAALKARIAEAPITQVTRMAAIGGGGYEWAGCRVPDEWNAKCVRLVVEE